MGRTGYGNSINYNHLVKTHLVLKGILCLDLRLNIATIDSILLSVRRCPFEQQCQYSEWSLHENVHLRRYDDQTSHGVSTIVYTCTTRMHLSRDPKIIINA